jgi:hypothetical protein
MDIQTPKRSLIRLRALGWSSRRGHDVNAAATTVKLDLAVDQSVDCVVAAQPNPLAGVKSCAYLADEDIAGSHRFAAESLYAAALGVAVASVSAGALSFFMCHEKSPLRTDTRFAMSRRAGGC